MRYRKIRIASAAMIVLLFVAAGMGTVGGTELQDHTDVVGVVGEDVNDVAHLGPTAGALGGDVVVIGEGDSVSNVGKEALTRHSELGNTGLTIVGETVGNHEAYFSSLKNDEDDYVFSVGTRVGDTTETSLKVISSHWNTDNVNTVAIADQTSVEDVVGTSQYARVNDVPVAYATNETQIQDVTSTFPNLQNVWISDSLSASSVDSNFSVTSLGTDGGVSFVNDHTMGSNTLLLTNSLSDVGYLQGVGDDADVMDINGDDGIPTDVKNYLSSNNPDVYTLTSSELDQSTKDAITTETSGVVEHYTYSSTEGLVARSTLIRNGNMEPLVVVGDDFTVQSTEDTDALGNVVSFDVRNIGLSDAESVRLEKENTASNYEFTKNSPDNVGEDEIVWEFSTLQADETKSVEYEFDQASEDGVMAVVPDVDDYNNVAGESFKTFSTFAPADWITDQVEGISDSLVGLKDTALGGITGTYQSIEDTLGSPILAIVFLLLVGLLGAGGLYYLFAGRDNEEVPVEG